MAIDFIDGFDHYTSGSHLERKGWVRTESTTGWSAGSGGRRGGGALTVTSAASTRRLERAIETSDRYCVGFAIRLSSVSGSGYFCYFEDGFTAQCGLRLNADGTISFHRGTTSIGTSTEIMPSEAYFHLELLVVIHNSAGSYELRLNGTNILSGSNVDTQDSGTAQATNFCLTGQGSTVTAISRDWRIDDFVLQSGAGADFLGDCRIDTLLPTSDGANDEFTSSTGTDNFAMVDDAAPDDDTTYVESSTVGHRDTYGFPDLSHTPESIFAIQVSPTARKVDSGDRSLATVVRSGGTNYDGAAQVMSTDYLVYPEVSETDPDTAAAWTAAGINAAEFGQKVQA